MQTRCSAGQALGRAAPTSISVAKLGGSAESGAFLLMPASYCRWLFVKQSLMGQILAPVFPSTHATPPSLVWVETGWEQVSQSFRRTHV